MREFVIPPPAAVKPHIASSRQKGFDTGAIVFDKRALCSPNHETNSELLMLYFAYGSNMDEQRVKAANRCPNARFIFNALLPAHRLVFTRDRDSDTCSTDAVPDPAASVWGVVYDITDSDRRQLDAREGLPIRAYRPKEVLVHPHGDLEQRVMLLTYCASDPTDIQGPPTRQYLGFLLRGARRWGLPADYIAQLERIEVSA
jgi:cation transport regulator ChaC